MKCTLPKAREARTVRCPTDAARVFKALLDQEDMPGQQQEHFWVAVLNSKNTITHVDLISLGTVNATIVHPREVFKPAFIHSATSILVCHNHPTGCTTPSREDILIAERLEKCARILGIDMVDFIVIGNGTEADAPVSFKEEGRL